MITREIELSEPLRNLIPRMSGDAFGVEFDDGVIAVVKNGDRWRAVEQIGHASDRAKFNASIYLPTAILASLKAGGPLVPDRAS